MFAPKELENEKKVILIYQLPCPWARARETSENSVTASSSFLATSARFVPWNMLSFICSWGSVGEDGYLPWRQLVYPVLCRFLPGISFTSSTKQQKKWKQQHGNRRKFIPFLCAYTLSAMAYRTQSATGRSSSSHVWDLKDFFVSEAIRRTTFSHPTETPYHPGWPWYISENTDIDMFSFTILSIPLICSSSRL